MCLNGLCLPGERAEQGRKSLWGWHPAGTGDGQTHPVPGGRVSQRWTGKAGTGTPREHEELHQGARKVTIWNEEDFRTGGMLLGNGTHECGLRCAFLAPGLFHPQSGPYSWVCAKCCSPSDTWGWWESSGLKNDHKKLYETFLVCVFRTCCGVCNTVMLAFSEPQYILVLIKVSVPVWSAAIHGSCLPWRYLFHNYLIQC